MTAQPLSPGKMVHFPNLSALNHHVDSAPTDNYNCIAWAAGDDTNGWWPDADHYWPPNVLRDATNVQSFVEAYASLGYEICADGTLEQGVEKIAIYVHPNGLPTHAARQLATGNWTSKLGRWEDIAHDTVAAVEGDCSYCYGHAHTYMRRQRAT